MNAKVPSLALRYDGMIRRCLYASAKRVHQSKLGLRPFASALPSSVHRCLSSSASRAPSKELKSEPETEIIFYEKEPGTLGLVKSGFVVSCFHTIYWIWYCVDFVPTVNAAAMTELHVDPMLPAIGVAFAFAIQAIFTGYPLRLVSKLGWRPSSSQLTIYSHSLPFMKQSSTPTVKPVGEIRLDPTSVEAQNITTMGNPQDFTGMLTIGKPGSFPPYLVHVRDGAELKEPELLLEMLLYPERIEEEFLTNDPPTSTNISSTKPRTTTNVTNVSFQGSGAYRKRRGRKGKRRR